MLSLWPSYYDAHFDLHIAVVLISIFDEVIHNQITKWRGQGSLSVLKSNSKTNHNEYTLTFGIF